MNRILIGLFAATVAVLTSISTAKVSHFNSGDIYGHTLANTYNKIYITYDIMLCLNITSGPCAYRELPAGFGIVTTYFTNQQAQEWVELGYLEPLGAGIFIGL